VRIHPNADVLTTALVDERAPIGKAIEFERWTFTSVARRFLNNCPSDEIGRSAPRRVYTAVPPGSSWSSVAML